MKRFRTLVFWQRMVVLGLLLAVMVIGGTLAYSVALGHPARADTTADVTVNATPAYVSVSCNESSYDFGVVSASSTPYTSTNYFQIDNTSTVQTDQTISVTTSTWSGGVTWTHSDTCTPGSDTAGMKANKGGTWGAGDVIVKNASPNYIAEDQAADTDYAFGLKLWAPTAFTDGVQKQIVTRISAAAG